MTPAIADRRLHQALLRAEHEDCKLLQKQTSAYLEYWRAAAEDSAASVPTQGLPKSF